jgi:uncharacterized protein (DUF2236 family)
MTTTQKAELGETIRLLKEEIQELKALHWREKSRHVIDDVEELTRRLPPRRNRGGTLAQALALCILEGL